MVSELGRKIGAIRKHGVRIRRLNFRLAPIFRANRGIPLPADAKAAHLLTGIAVSGHLYG
jgi:hypothetical protein